MAKQAKAKPKKEYKLDIFQILEAIDRKDDDFFLKMPEDDRKSMAFVPLVRWMSAVQNPRFQETYLRLTNEIINIGEPLNTATRQPGQKNNGYLAFSKHPDLQWLLLTVIGRGSAQRHEYFKTNSIPKSKIDELLLTHYHDINDQELELVRSMYDVDDIKQLAKGYGFSDKEIRELLK